MSHSTTTTIYSLGYAGADIDGFIDELKANAIDCVADVRAAPFSRKPDFAKRPLRRHLNTSAIEYRHLPGLGNPKAGREAAAAGDLVAYRRIFAEHLTSTAAETALSEVMRLAQSARVCLLCLEAEPIHCHRGLICEHLAKAYGVSVHHLRLGGQRQFPF